MKIISLDDMNRSRFSFDKIHSLYMRSGWTMLNSPYRKLNGFLLIDKGECTYSWDDKEEVLSHGSLIYLPHGSVHVVKTESFQYYRIDFETYDISDGERVIFTDRPWVITKDAPAELYEYARSLSKNTTVDDNIFASIADLCGILACVKKLVKHGCESRISPAIDYINLHYTENITIEQLAEMCYMSPSHMHRLFKEELGASPIDYRNRIRIKKACALISGGECSVGEAAITLGFENIYYFSRVFKHHMGVSPTQYRRGV